MDTSPDRAAAFRAVARSQNHTLRNVAVVVAGALLLLCCAGGVGYKLLGAEQDRAVLRAARDTTERFVRDLQLGDHSAAYGLLCAGTRTELTQEHFDSDVRAQPHIQAHRITEAHRLDADGRAGAVVIEELTLDSGTVDQHTFTVVKEDRSWRVCNRSWPY